ncbi:glycosyltransferase [Fusicatenibacter saccharivorans]|uniref:glycosyltransferase n=1 Tax=Fusicatenibacter saccharivorans TaxID=1150298 RepID=UPI003CFD73C7
MKLLHITATHLNPAGGVPVVLKELVSEQNKIDGFSARVLSLKASVDKMDSIYFDELQGGTFSEYINDFSPDICILHSFYYIEYNNVVKELKKKKIPYLIEPHGSFGKSAMDKSRLKKFIANHTIFRKQIVNSIGYVFLNKEEYNDSIYHKKHDIVIPNGVCTDDIEHGYQNKKRSFYFIGRYDVSHKGLDYLFDALDILESEGEHLHVDFYGTGSEEQCKYVNHRIDNYHNLVVKNNGPIYGSDKKIQLEQKGIMLLVSRYEGFPMTVLEAWKYGNPCIVTPGTNVYAETRDTNLGWVTALDSREIAKTIKCANREYSDSKEKYITNCKNYVTATYAWSCIAQQSYNTIKDVLSSI